MIFLWYSDLQAICSVVNSDEEFKTLARRWHPGQIDWCFPHSAMICTLAADKFRQRFASSMSPQDRAEIMKEVQRVFQEISAIRTRYFKE